MNKVLKVLSLSFLLCLSLVVAPFHISANAPLSAPFVGYNVYIFDYDSMNYVQTYNVDLDDSNFKMTCTSMLSSGGCNTYQQGSNNDITGTISLQYAPSVKNTIYKADIILDSNYIGYVNITAFGYTKNWYVNGNMISFTWTDSQSDNQTITINSYQLTRISSDSIMWSFPFESYSYINYFVKSYPSQMGTFYNSALYQFPSFDMQNNQQVVHLWVEEGKHNYWVFASSFNIYDESTFRNAFTFSSDLTVNQIKRVSFDLYNFNFSGVSVDFTCDYTGDLYVNTNSARTFIPIYLASEGYPISTEFALSFGLSNDLLDALVYGSNSSIQSESILDDKTSDLNQSSNQLVTQEDNFNNDMNNALQNIDTNFNVGTNFGSKFIASADWVKTQYDRLTGNTPFGSVISFSLLIGLALLLVGRVFK